MLNSIIRTVSSTTPPWPWLSSRLFSTSSLPSSTSTDKSFMLSYLIGTCGFPPKTAASVSNRLTFETSEKPDAVVAFFKSHGLSEAAAFKVLRFTPRLLVTNPERTLQPKIDFFKSKGFSTSDISKIIVGWPPILTRSLQNEIIPCFDFLESMILSKEMLLRTVIRYAGVLCDLESCIIPNVKLLRDAGVPESLIVKFIQYFPLSLKAPLKKFKEAVQEAKEMQLDPLRLQFVIVVHVMLNVSKTTWARREGIFRRWGWTDDDISAAFRVHPFCISVSDNKIEAIMDFLVNTLATSLLILPGIRGYCP
ncbi:hypothetical protein PIB30_037308 [Stylosanthes scabra]|uniref:Mitochondrial transcription termination factor family protein n=1 Tax=Stylosanthes scabra TaxID=79078 RepID=A0ABU6YDY0_9FABA|nr:hypothetical protein [Stylosanthes scabra]